MQPQDRCAQEFLGVGVDEHPHQPGGFAFEDRAADAAHRHLGLENIPARCPRLIDRHTNPAERRIGIQGVDGHSAVDRTRRVLQDQTVLIGRVCERAVPVYITQSPHALYRGLEAVVDGEEAAIIGRKPMIRTEQIGVGATAGRQQQMAALDRHSIPQLRLTPVPAGPTRAGRP